MTVLAPGATRSGSLIIVPGDLWQYHEEGWRVVVTTNIGWDPESGRNNMGAGVALQASQRWPDLPLWYGVQCEMQRQAMPVIQHSARRLIFLPVKPLLDPLRPEISWDQEADLGLIKRGLRQVAGIALEEAGPRVALSFPGCGNGGLPESLVLPVMQETLSRAARAGRLQVVSFSESVYSSRHG
jgi:hypothetical protein